MFHRPAPCVFRADARGRLLWGSLDLEGEALLLPPRGAHLEASQGLAGLLPLPTRVCSAQKKPHVPQTPKMEVWSPAWGFPSLTTGVGRGLGRWLGLDQQGGRGKGTPSMTRAPLSAFSEMPSRAGDTPLL